MDIKVNSGNPIHSPPYNLPNIDREHLRNIVNTLKDALIVNDSFSDYASPAFLVTKGDANKKPLTQLTAKDRRMVVNFRKLNIVIVQDRFALPRIDNIISELRGNTYFSTFDFLSGYYQ